MIEKFEWTPDISVYNEEIDNQHKRLLAKINELIEAIINNKETEVIQDIVKFLGKYIFEHFLYEEVYMDEHSFPGLIEHKRRHNDFVERYLNFENRIKAGEISDGLAEEVEVFLGEWWINHIKHADKMYANYIKENKG